MNHESASINEMYRNSTAAKTRDVSMYNIDFFAHALRQGTLPLNHSLPQRPRSFWSAPRVILGADQENRGFWEREYLWMNSTTKVAFETTMITFSLSTFDES